MIELKLFCNIQFFKSYVEMYEFLLVTETFYYFIIIIIMLKIFSLIQYLLYIHEN